MTLQDRLELVLQAIGLDMKSVRALAGARHLPVMLRGGDPVAVPLSLHGGLAVGLAAGGTVSVLVEA